ETKATENACKNTGSVYLGRDVFLEADKNRSYAGVCNRLLETANLAKQNGTAIAIGHVGAEGGENTAKAIIDTLPKIKEMGVKIVPLHEIYETLKNQ
ncbi:MAG: divergent polysaccharide deacetylase family protein, partial [Clostridia bacterium]|nr:divergent polysaccharide deacetylase family protein [Clostridia bacterium]